MDVQRVLMISTDSETAPQPTVPLGAAWGAEALRLSGLEVRFLDLCFQKKPLAAVEDAIRTFRPDGIAFSIRNLDNCDFLAPKSYLPAVKEMVGLVGSRSDARTLVGGAGVSLMPLQVLEYLGLDHAVVGEGERAAPAFFRAARLADACQVPGVVSRRGGMPKPPHLSSQFVPPQTHGWVDTRRYLGLEPVLPVQGKRGCANRCLYCTYHKVEGENWRIREPADVVEEIASAMRQTGAREFEFVDSVFNEPPGYLELLLEEILRKGVRARFSVSSLSPKGLTVEQVRLMERAGMTSLVITPESAADATLAALGKGFTEAEVHRSAELLSGSSIRALWCFLVGGPSESEESVAKTVSFVNRLPRKESAYITTGIRIYPGTGLHRLALEEGVVEADQSLLHPAFYFTRELTLQKTMEMLQRGVSDPCRCIFPAETRGANLSMLRRLGVLLRLPTPFWRYAGYAKKISPGGSG
ncbi:cobalamin-binding protein [Geoanaerobacter pelophilus]|uniref:Cobalamin-binding protein n=1 Tax=Geoanaerobacter pelophilus TaxID=60036 RepID=A0ABQ0MDL1_9BACT|nr:cobalamin-binding protein [Geoanaerobacter pelophilus]